MDSRTQLMEKYLAGLLKAGFSREKIDLARRRMEAYHSTQKIVLSTISTTEYSTFEYRPTEYSFTEYNATEYSTTEYSTSEYRTTEYSPVVYSTAEYSTAEYNVLGNNSSSESIGNVVLDVVTEIGERISEVGTTISEIVTENVTQVVQALENVTLSVTEMSSLSTGSGVLTQAEGYTNGTTAQWGVTPVSVVTSDLMTAEMTGMETNQADNCDGHSLQGKIGQILKSLFEDWKYSWSMGEGSTTAGIGEQSVNQQVDHEWEAHLSNNQTLPGSESLLPPGMTSPLAVLLLLGITILGKKFCILLLKKVHIEMIHFGVFASIVLVNTVPLQVLYTRLLSMLMVVATSLVLPDSYEVPYCTFKVKPRPVWHAIINSYTPNEQQG